MFREDGSLMDVLQSLRRHGVHDEQWPALHYKWSAACGHDPVGAIVSLECTVLVRMVLIMWFAPRWVFSSRRCPESCCCAEG